MSTIPSTMIGGASHPYELLRLNSSGVLPNLALTAKLKQIDDATAPGAKGLALLAAADNAAAYVTLSLGTAALEDTGAFDVAGAAADAQTAAETYADGLDATAEHTANKGQANGYAGLDAGGKVPSSQLPAAVVGAMSYIGGWNANTNSPDITETPAKGQFWIVSTDGATNLSGITDWKIGDWAVYDGAAWTKIDNTDKVASVNGYVGVVSLDVTDIDGAEATANKDQADGYAGLNGAGRLTADVRDNSITTDNLQADAVKTAKIENFAVTEGKINTGAVTVDKIGTGAVTEAKIGDDSVSTAKLQNSSVNASKLADNAVTTAKLYAEAVTEGKIAPNAIVASKITDGAVTENKIAAYNVTESRIANDAVNARVLADDAVETAKILDGNVTAAKLASDSVITAKILDANVTAAKLAADSVETAKILNANVTTAKLADAAVTAAKTSSAIALVDGSRAFTGPITTAGMKRAVAIKTADFTLGNTDDIVLINAAAADIAGELPAATGSGREYRVGRIDNVGAAQEAKVVRSGTDTIVTAPGANATEVEYFIKGESTCFVDVSAGIWFAF